ncbi:AEC family transporter [Candidatus Bathyarchaeota archaeon]|nr:AEC family transporter [Candidatus Bathyarchaeota archaeon]MCK4669520.1 AEC family transporter [Candidatus Bathyarchaeota archaeon]
MSDIILRTIIPILLLMGTGLLSRKLGILKSGDERILSAYVYYFALPALFFVNMTETNFTEETLRFILAGIIPILIAMIIYTSLYVIFRFSKNMLYLLILSTIFGSLAFFGIPFITFAFPGTGEPVATLGAASISIVSVTASITTLELYRLQQSKILTGLKLVVKRLSRNPLILSIFSGILLSLIRIEIPTPISQPLHMLGSTTSTVAIFMLGVFLYGRRYTNISKALKLSMLRIIFLPTIAFLTTMLFDLSTFERSALILMHGMPVAISMIILSERYNFYKETIASLILISSLGAGLYLSLWLLLLGHY